jgi:hypothetical protein
MVSHGHAGRPLHAGEEPYIPAVMGHPALALSLGSHQAGGVAEGRISHGPGCTGGVEMVSRPTTDRAAPHRDIDRVVSQ